MQKRRGPHSRAERAAKAAEEEEAASKILTLRQYAEKTYLPAKEVACSGTTVASFRGNLRNYIYPALGDSKLPEITSGQITAMLRDIQAEGKAHQTVVKVYTVIRSLLKMAYMEDVIDRNPMDKVERPKPRKDEIKKSGEEAYTAEEVRYIMECLRKEPLKWQTYLCLLIDTGIRRGEGCGLTWDNIDFDAGTVTIDKNVNYTKERGTYVDTPKNRRVRRFDVAPHVLSLLRQMKEEQNRNGIQTNWVFTQNDSGEVMFPHSPNRYMTNFMKKYGIQHLHPHKLRHSFASIAITNGADVASVSEKLGHSDKAVTLRMYTHANEESIRRAGQVFRDALFAPDQSGET